MAVIGIDLGTTNSLAAVWRNGKVELIPDALGNLITPSVVAVDEDGNLLVGQAAKEEELHHPERCASSFKRFMGTEKKYSLGTREFTPEELSALVLKKIKEMAEEYLQEEVTEAVISVPAYFNNDQRYATKQAAELAGIYCERLINEPSAAALAERQGKTEEEYLLVFDFGGGTLDVSLVDCFENIVEINTIAGDNHLGGTDFDQAIASYFCNAVGIMQNALTPVQWSTLLLEARRCKETLSIQEEVEMCFDWKGNTYSQKLTPEDIFHAGKGLFLRIRDVVSKALMDGGLSPDDISKVLLAGGSSCMPTVSLYLGKLFGRSIKAGTEPDYLIATGLGIYTGIKERKEEIKDIMMTDVCPFSLGVATHFNNCDQEKMDILIERNSILPSRMAKTYIAHTDYQESIRFEIYQGEHYIPEKNLKIGTLDIEIPKAKKGEEEVVVTFSYDINGILEVNAMNPSTGNTANTTIVSGYRRLSQEQLEAQRGEIDGLKRLSKELEEQKAIFAMGERLYAQTTGGLRDAVERTLDYYRCVCNSHSPIRIRKAGRGVLQFFLNAEIQRKRTVFDTLEFQWEDLFEESEEEQ